MIISLTIRSIGVDNETKTWDSTAVHFWLRLQYDFDKDEEL